jgi:hypothetical protein
MEAIEQLQVELGAPFVSFALQNWLVIAVICALVAFYLIGTSGNASVSLWMGSDNDPGDGDGGDGGGGDGGGGGD